MTFLKSAFFNVYDSIAYKNCFVCDFKVVFVFGCLTLAPIKFNCPHSSTPTEIKFEPSRICLMTVSLIVTISGAAMVYVFWELLTEPDSFQCFILFNELSIFFCAFIMLLGVILKITEKARELQGIVEISKRATTHGLVLIDDKFVRKVKLFAYPVILLFTTTQFFAMLYFWYENSYTASSLITLLYNTIFLMEGTLVVHFVPLLMLYPLVFKKLSAEIRSTLKIRLLLCENLSQERFLKLLEAEETILIKHTSQINMENKLQGLRNLYTSAFWNYKQHNKYINPTFLVWWLTITASTIVTVYLLIQCMIYERSLDFLTKLRILKVFVNMASVCIFFYLAEMTSNVVSAWFLYTFIYSVKFFSKYIKDIASYIPSPTTSIYFLK